MSKKSKICQTRHNYNLDRLLAEWDYSKSGFMDDMWYISNDGSRQTCIQYHPHNKNRFTDGCGSISRSAPLVENDYNLLNTGYMGTLFENIIDELDAVRSRVMVKKKHTTYSIHTDKAPRYHMALETNPHAYFLFPETKEIIHIPADGYIYEVDTTIPHTFINCGEDRTHLVMVKND